MASHRIETRQQLVDLIGEPNDIVKGKVETCLDAEMVAFIARSPLLLVSTIDGQGNPDISPKGDPAGFVRVEGNQLLHIPDRPGNKLLFGFMNLLENPSVGIIFVVPNTRETLRIKGKAELSTDPALLEAMSVNGKPALLVTSVTVEECFFHCGKALIRSRLWDPASWGEPGKSIIARQLAKKMDGGNDLEALIDKELEKNYREELY